MAVHRIDSVLVADAIVGLGTVAAVAVVAAGQGKEAGPVEERRIAEVGNSSAVGTVPVPVHEGQEVAVAHKELEDLEGLEVVGRRDSVVGSPEEVVDIGLAGLEGDIAVGQVEQSRDIADFAEAQGVLAEDNHKVVAVAVAAQVEVDSSPGQADVVPDSPVAAVVAHRPESLANTEVAVKTCGRLFSKVVNTRIKQWLMLKQTLSGFWNVQPY